MQNESREVYADVFARALVMPENEFKKAVVENTIDEMCDVEKVAQSFNVKYLDALMRGRELGLFE